MTDKLVAITGNTYPVRIGLRNLGGVWNSARKAWMVPADEARALVADAKSWEYPRGPHRANAERKLGGSRYRDGQSYTYTDSYGKRRFVLGDDD